MKVRFLADLKTGSFMAVRVRPSAQNRGSISWKAGYIELASLYVIAFPPGRLTGDTRNGRKY